MDRCAKVEPGRCVLGGRLPARPGVERSEERRAEAALQAGDGSDQVVGWLQQADRAAVLLAQAFQERVVDRGINAEAMHPQTAAAWPAAQVVQDLRLIADLAVGDQN